MGQLKTKVAGLDHESDSLPIPYTVVTATGSAKKADSEDSEESKVTAAVTIAVIDKQEPPMFDEATTTPRNVQETDTGEITPAVSAIDPDMDDSVTYFLSAPGTTPFRIATGTNRSQ